MANERAIKQIVSLEERNQNMYFEMKKKDTLICNLKHQLQNALKEIERLESNQQTIKSVQSECMCAKEKNKQAEEIDLLSSELETARQEIDALKLLNENNEQKLMGLLLKNEQLELEQKQQIQKLSRDSNRHLVQKNNATKKAVVEAVVDDENVYEVEAILNHKVTRNHRKFLIKWKNFDKTHDSWEKESDLKCPNILKQYLKLKNLA